MTKPTPLPPFSPLKTNCMSRSYLLTNHSNRRLDNQFNIFEGLFQNWFFIGISLIMCGGQVLIIFVGGQAFDIASPKQTPLMWGTAILLGFISIPIGVVIRLIPDSLLENLVPESLKRRAQSKNVPGLSVSDEDERFNHYPAPFADVRDELAFLKRLKGGRINNLKFAMKHPRETFIPKYKSPSHSRQNSRSNSIKVPSTPTRENSFSSNAGVAAPGSTTPDSRKRSRSMRSRSNSVLGAATLMTGLVAGSVGAAGWSPIDRAGDWQQFPPTKLAPSPLGGAPPPKEDEQDPSR